MNRRRPAPTHPPALYRMARDADGERMVVWPLHSAAPLAHDGRPDEHVYIRRDLVRRALISPPEQSRPSGEPCVPLVGAGARQTARSGLARAWAALLGWWGKGRKS